jgi:hypothetical protein
MGAISILRMVNVTPGAFLIPVQDTFAKYPVGQKVADPDESAFYICE